MSLIIIQSNNKIVDTLPIITMGLSYFQILYYHSLGSWLTGVFGCCEAKSEPELSVCMCERVRQRLRITTCLSNSCSMLAHERCITAEPGGYKSVIITGMPVQRIFNTVDLQLSSNGAELTVHVLCYCAPDECI